MNTDLIPSPASGRILLLVSPDSLLEPLFEMVARLALQGPLCVLDSGNVFQGYFLARALRRYTCDPQASLQQVMLSRAFTCYQVSAFLNQETIASQPILVLDLLATFYDQGVRANERRRLLQDCLKRLRTLSQAAPVAMWVRQRASIPQDALGFIELVQAAAGQVWSPPRRPSLPIPQQMALFS